MAPEWKMLSTEEKRRNPRFERPDSRECPIDFEGLATGAQLSDLSRDGLSFQSPSPLQVNQTYHLRISDLKSEKKIPCEVQVMWTSMGENGQCTCGAKIVQMDPSDKMDLLDVFYDDWKKGVLS